MDKNEIDACAEAAVKQGIQRKKSAPGMTFEEAVLRSCHDFSADPESLSEIRQAAQEKIRQLLQKSLF